MFPLSCISQHFAIFFRWCKQQAWDILLTPIWIYTTLHNSTLQYTTQNWLKICWGLVYHKIGASDTNALQEGFWQELNTWKKTIEHLVANFRRLKKQQMPVKATVIKLIQPELPTTFRTHERDFRSPPENQHAVSHKKLAFRDQFWGSSMMTLSSSLTKFKYYIAKNYCNKPERLAFYRVISEEIENDSGRKIWLSSAMKVSATWVGTSINRTYFPIFPWWLTLFTRTDFP